MKLIPKAKPVRIRITSGNEEHYSLETLQKNFVWRDISLLFDGRLTKWLRRINAQDIAERLSSFLENSNNNTNSIENIIGIYNILFRIKSPFNNAEDVFSECHHDNSLTPLVEELISYLSSSELIDYGIRYGYLSELFVNRLACLSKSFTGDESGKDLFSVGEFLYHSNVYKEAGEKCIRLAIKRGYREAYDFKKKYFPNPNIFSDEDFDNVLKSKETIDTLRKSWRYHSIIRVNGTNWNSKIIYDFSNVCLEIYKESKIVSSANALWLIASKYFEGISESDPLYQEKCFILCLFDIYLSQADRRLNRIKNYPPARIMLESRQFSIEGHTYKMGQAFSNATHLKYLVNNIINFRNYDESSK